MIYKDVNLYGDGDFIGIFQTLVVIIDMHQVPEICKRQ